MPLRPEELSAAQAFEKLMLGYALKVKWHPVEPDPPDLCFTVECDYQPTERWAVEVTGLFQYVDWNGNTKNVKNVEAPLRVLSERLTKTLSGKAITGYIISATGPFEVDLKDIEARALEYIDSGKTEAEYLDLEQAVAKIETSLTGDPSDPRIEEIMRSVAESQSRFSIRATTVPVKISWMGGLDGTARTPNGEGMIADVMVTLKNSLQRILDAKLPRMKRLIGYDRKMLLIWSEYYFAEPERVKEILDDKRLTKGDIDAIFLIDGRSVSCVADPAGLFWLTSNPTAATDVAGLAYELWERRGCPFGSPEVDWFEAERQLNRSAVA